MEVMKLLQRTMSHPTEKRESLSSDRNNKDTSISESIKEFD